MTDSIVVPVSGSFRDPGGRIYLRGDRVFRTVTSISVSDYEYVRNTGLIDLLVEKGKLVDEKQLDKSEFPDLPSAEYLLEHPRIDFISYPYEWSFSLLKDAALHQLDVILESLRYGVTLSDATAYNIQFKGIKPIFIDHLSFRKYQEGEYWLAHKQFCDQFLNPLLLRSLLGVSHNAWYRGSLEGISAEDLNPLLKFHHKLKLGVFTNVVLQSKLQKKSNTSKAAISTGGRALQKQAFEYMISALAKQISKIHPKDTGGTVWGGYEKDNSYEDNEEKEKINFIANFSSMVKPGVAWDLGCNNGKYSEVLLENGTGRVIGFDFDQDALDAAYARAKNRKLDFLPLFFDAANPSPDQGWSQNERNGLSKRANSDALIALAFIHHLAIAKNIPLNELVRWLVEMAPVGVIEFIPKSDPMVLELLSLREDIFHDYDEANFIRCLSCRAKIVKKKIISSSGRTLYWYQRT